jgi:hypothetical protein
MLKPNLLMFISSIVLLGVLLYYYKFNKKLGLQMFSLLKPFIIFILITSSIVVVWGIIALVFTHKL